jgi:hypothetical protein
MNWWLAGVFAWVVLSALAAIIIARSIHLADEKEKHGV